MIGRFARMTLGTGLHPDEAVRRDWLRCDLTIRPLPTPTGDQQHCSHDRQQDHDHSAAFELMS
jgi:hypothetical protein